MERRGRDVGLDRGEGGRNEDEEEEEEEEAEEEKEEGTGEWLRRSILRSLGFPRCVAFRSSEPRGSCRLDIRGLARPFKQAHDHAHAKASARQRRPARARR